MTIRYPNGVTLDALLLSRGDEELSAAIPVNQEVRRFRLVEGTWRSEQDEHVQIEFAWQRQIHAKVPAEDECICSKRLASRLISMIQCRSDDDDVTADSLYVFAAEPNSMRVRRSRLERLRK